MTTVHLHLTESDDQLRAAFRNLRTRRDVADMLHVTDQELIYLLFRTPAPRYRRFSIRKRDGSERPINAPRGSLKIVQQKLNQVLQAIYRPVAPVHGFARDRSIVSNAQRHVQRRWVFNLDIEDFFPTIHFGRVMGMFSGNTYRVPERAAKALAQICCYRGELPQGAPTSPVVSNMVCGPLDIELRRFAADHHCHYTRYVDDITFSSNALRIPTGLAQNDDGRVRAGPALQTLIEANGFRINEAKVRLRRPYQRQEVTGLVANAVVNVPREFVRRVRGMLHAWERFGEAAAEQEFQTRYDRKQRRPGGPSPRFRDVLRGRLEFIRMIKGADSPVFIRQWNRLHALAPADYRPIILEIRASGDVPSALWVIESDDGQGTGFDLRGYGVVTCAHCLGPGTVAFKAEKPERKYAVEVLHRSDDLDLAVLRLAPEAPGGGILLEGASDEVEPGTRVELFGFPEYAPGNRASRNPTTITGRRRRFNTQLFTVNTVVVAGASGGPAVDESAGVIGIVRSEFDRKGLTQPSLIDVAELSRLYGGQGREG